MESKLIGTKDAAEIIGVTQREVQHLCEVGTLPHQRISGRYLIRQSDAEYLRENPPKSGPKRKAP